MFFNEVAPGGCVGDGEGGGPAQGQGIPHCHSGKHLQHHKHLIDSTVQYSTVQYSTV